jgi:thymidine kinase
MDTRDKGESGQVIAKSRIGLESPCITFGREENLYKLVFGINQFREKSVVIVDECQFLSREQVDQLKEISAHIPVLCYGLLTNFKTELFEGSKRLVEIAESLMEIKFVCSCGRKATLNGRFIDGKLVTEGEEILLGKEEFYRPLCYNCYHTLKHEANNEKETPTT